MKKILLMIFIFGLFLFPSSISFAADESQIVNSFNQLTDSQINPILESYNNPTNFDIKYIGKDRYSNGGFYKVTMVSINRYTMDIQKTSSLLSPYTGYAEFNIMCIVGRNFATRDQSLIDNGVQSSTIRTYRFNYAYQNNEWVLQYIESKNNSSEEENHFVRYTETIESIKYKF